MAGFFENIGNLFSGSAGTSAANRAAQVQKQSYRGAAKAGTGLLTDYTNKAIATEKQGLPQWQQIFGQGTQAAPTYFGASGVGPGVDAAQQAWESSIPYQFLQNQLPIIQEAAFRRGGASGQTGRIAPDLANATMQSLYPFFTNWQNTLNPLPYETAGAAGQQSIYDIMGGQQANLGTALSNLKTQSILGKGNTEAQRIQNVFGANQAAGRNSLDALFAAADLGVNAFAPAGGLGLGSLFGSKHPMNQVTPGTGPTLSNDDQYMYWGQ